MGRNGFRCFECDAKADHAHHVVPLVRGGKKTIPLCYKCHSKVHDADFTKHSELVKEGMRKAALQGKRVAGHNVKEIDIDVAKRLLNEGLSYSAVGRALDVSERTIRRKLGVDKASSKERGV